MGFVFTFGILALATYEVIWGGLALSAYTAILFFSLTLWGELERFNINLRTLLQNWVGFERIVEIFNEHPAIQDAPDAEALSAPQADLHFDGLTFHYNENKGLIRDFNLQIKAGEKIGILGPSGAGKSTLVKLLMRFYDVEAGALRINGQDIRDVTQDSLHAHIAVIPQDVTLFNHPIENIRYGRLDATDAEVHEAAHKAFAHDFIQDLPDGYNTVVGERGVKLSGGQRQRIAIARAILKDAPILVLDEATSALDSESEHYIQQSLANLMKGKTVIAIAHRLSTIATLDRLVVMDNGAIVQQGSHKTLLQDKGGLYAKLWDMQAGGSIGG